MKTLNKQTLSSAFVLLVLTVLVSACGSGGIVKPQNFEQQLAYAYGTHTAVLQATANAVSYGALTSKDGEHVLKLADDTYLLLSSAKVAVGVGDMATAQGQLALATNILTQLQAYLNSKSKVQP